MLIIGCDFHPGFQQVAIFDNQTGEVQEKRLRHRDEAEQFYGSLAAPARVGMEACGHYPWFEQWLARCGHELWLGDAAKIRAGVVRKRLKVVPFPIASCAVEPFPSRDGLFERSKGAAELCSAWADETSTPTQTFAE